MKCVHYYLLCFNIIESVHRVWARAQNRQSDSLDYMGATVKYNQSKVVNGLIVQ